MIDHTDRHYGPGSRDRTEEASDPGSDGARAALESFYHALNDREIDTMRAVWAAHPLAQLNNPVGGMLRGGGDAVDLYARIFGGRVQLIVTLGDIVEYLDDQHAVFAGRETGQYVVDGGDPVELQIRTTRYFRYDGGAWRQFHHHGSIDDPDALAAYQAALRT